MLMTGLYRVALVPDADPAAFERHMKQTVFNNPSALQLTRITRSFTHHLLDAGKRQYVWQADVDLVTDAGYDFVANGERVAEQVREHAVLVDVDSFRHV